MKNVLINSLCAFMLLFSSCDNGEKLLLAGSGWNKIVIIDKDSKEIEWEYPVEDGWECNSVTSTPEGNILFSYKKGARMVDRSKKTLWDIPAPEGAEMQTARLLPDGNYLLAWAGSPMTILEVSPKGEELHRVTYETGIENPHAQIRQVNKTSKGNYLVPLFATSSVVELSRTGQVLRVNRVGGNLFTTVPADANHDWVACGDAHRLVKMNLLTGKMDKVYNQDDIPGVKLFFVAGLCPTPEGGLYVCNWQGHDKNAVAARSPQVFELDAEGNVVWDLNDNASFGKISTIDIVKK